MLGAWWRRMTMGTVGKRQEELDFLRVFTLRSYYAALREYGAANYPGNEAQVEEFVSTRFGQHWNLPVYASHRAALDADLDKEMLAMLTYVRDGGAMDPYPQPIHGYTVPTSKDSSALLDALAQKHLQETRADTDIVEKTIPHYADGFSLVVSRSNIAHEAAGLGVWVKGKASPGTVMGIYPGQVIFPEAAEDKDLAHNTYCLSRYDGTLINAREWEYRAAVARQKTQHLALGKISNRFDHEVLPFRNPFAIMHYVNHPPPGVSANILGYLYDFPVDFNDTLRPYVPHEYKTKPGWLQSLSPCYMRSLVMIATRFIEDEELYLNYRYNPQAPHPDWYVQPAPQEVEDRWR